MTKYRLRPQPFRSADEEQQHYGRTYPDGYRHDRWPDHVERIEASVELLSRWSTRFESAADLSCGDAAILRGLAGRSKRLKEVWLGDLLGVQSAAWVTDSAVLHTVPPAPLPDSLASLPGVGSDDAAVDLFVLSETLEHMPDPDALLRDIADWAHYLFISTPLSEPVGSGNPEHYWGWSDADIHDMLMDSGWTPLEKQLLTPQSTLSLPDAYTFQLWLAVAP